MKFEKNEVFGGLPLRRGMDVQPQKEKCIIPESRKNFLKILWKLFDF